jgi:PAS domain S-box-containing protein
VLIVPEAEPVLAAILESAEDAIVGIALDGAIVLWSRGAEQLYGYSAAEVQGHSVSHLIPLYEIPALEAALRAARKSVLEARETVDPLPSDSRRPHWPSQLS